jgi:hypothetical protein
VKKTPVAALLSLALFSSCLGPNRLFNELHEWNTTVTPEKWQNEAIFVACNVFLLYPLAYLADITVFNSVEWWGGTSLIKDKL